MAARKMPLPVADSQLIEKMAASVCAAGTTGGTRRIAWCRNGTGIRMTDRLSSHAFTLGMPQMKTMTLRMIHGVHARRMVAADTAAASASSGADLKVCATSPCSGCQTRRNIVTAPSDTTAATTSTSHGPWKLEFWYWGTAYEMPATAMA